MKNKKLDWEACYRILEEFRGKHGHLRISPAVPDFSVLKKWILEQRARHPSLKQEQIEKLLVLGFDFGGRDTQWYLHFFELRDFIARHGRLPKYYRRTAKEKSLAAWMNNQIKRQACRSLQQIKWLEGLGVRIKESWKQAIFKQRLKELNIFKARHGHCRVPYRFNENPALTAWVQRIRSGKYQLSETQRRQLNDAGFEWNFFRKVRWENRYNKLADYLKEHGHFPIRSEGHRQLREWMTLQRKHKSALTPEQRQRLNMLGFSWNPKMDQWERRYLELKKFRKRFGHCEVSARDPKFKPLYHWIYAQKARRYLMSASRRERFDALVKNSAEMSTIK